MLTSLKTFLRNYFAQFHDVRNKDAMSMTLHDCIRLVKKQQQLSELRRTDARVHTSRPITTRNETVASA